MSPGIFGSMFDFNNDGELSAFESAAECMFFHEVLMREDKAPPAEPCFYELRSTDSDEN